MKKYTSPESVLIMTIDSLPLSEECKKRLKLLRIDSVKELLGQRFHELDQLIGRKYINEIRLFTQIKNLVVTDNDPIEFMDFKNTKVQDEEILCVKFKFRQFDFKRVDCYPTLELWAAYIEAYGLKLISFQGLLDCQSVIKRFSRLIGEQDKESLEFCCVVEKTMEVIELQATDFVKDGDHFVVSKL